MTYKELLTRLKGLKKNNIDFISNRLAAFVNGETSIEEANKEIQLFRWQNLRNSIIQDIMLELPNNNNIAIMDDIWPILERVERKRKYAAKYREKIDKLYAEIATIVESTNKKETSPT